MKPPAGPRRCLAIEGVCHTFGDVVAADHVDLEVRSGQVHCLLGPSGSGKSTLLRLIAGLETLQRGSISIAGVEVAGPRRHKPPEERSVGLVFQDYALFPHLSVRRNVTFGMDDRSRKQQHRSADELLERVGMSAYAEAMPHTLSGGQQQRAALARALAREPAVMLLDEPFSGLDERLRGEVRRNTLDILRAAGVATLMVTHDPRESLLAGDVVSVLRAGRIAQTGSPDEVYHRSLDPWVAEVFGPVNRIPGTVHSGRVSAPWGVLEASELDDGPVEILVRPAAVALSREAAGASARELAPGAPGRHVDRPQRGRITAVESAGDLANLTVTVGDHVLEVQDFARRGWQAGDEVAVDVAAGAAVIRAAERSDGGI